MIKITGINELEESFFTAGELEPLPEVERIINDVKLEGDSAVRRYTELLDGVVIESSSVSRESISAARGSLRGKLRAAVEQSIENCMKFAERQRAQFDDFNISTQPGVVAGQRVIPIERAGVYIPGGSYPLLSSVVMTVVPAKAAGVRNISLCSPPAASGEIDERILAVADMLGVDNVYKIGGAQAIAALAFGTETIDPVDIIVGPGNKYVTYAKKLVYGITAIDFIAGPSEILIIADQSADSRLVAADMIAQAEHDADASAVLVTTSQELAEEVSDRLMEQLKKLENSNIAEISLRENGKIIFVENLQQAVSLANRKAPEHLELMLKEPGEIKNELRNYGSLFIGAVSAEVFGDYNSGLNHVLPTNFAARYTGGLSVMNFLKLQTTLEMSSEGLNRLGQNTAEIARSEMLMGHAASVELRLRNTDREK